MKYTIYVLVLLLTMGGCKEVNEDWQNESDTADWLHNSMAATTDVIVHDIFSPPVASRIYAYVSLAAHAAYQSALAEPQHIVTDLRGFDGDLSPADGIVSPALCANVALMTTASALVFSEAKVQLHRDSVLAHYHAIGMPDDVYQRSIDHGHHIAQVVLAYADSDNYKETRSYPKYGVEYDESSWKPTPPAYMDGIEPSWNKIRAFTLTRPDQFKPAPPTPYDMTEGSAFYNEVIEVYKAVTEATDEDRAIASFWDCNPYVLNVTGHVMHATKKITPGGHWINITALASQVSNASAEESLTAYAYTSIALADAFISCWDEKYRSKLIRPETVINEHLDPTWRPLLQTPPFPEYTSGHSVISAAAATVLSRLYGDQFAFDDDTEVKYGLPVRSYTSFIDAAMEAAVSRLYGGIHYRPAIDNGVTQGFAVGKHVLSELDVPALASAREDLTAR